MAGKVEPEGQVRQVPPVGLPPATSKPAVQPTEPMKPTVLLPQPGALKRSSGSTGSRPVIVSTNILLTILGYFVTLFDLNVNRGVGSNYPDYLTPPKTQQELNAWVLENPDVGLFSLAYLAGNTRNKCALYFIRALLLLVVVVQLVIPYILYDTHFKLYKYSTFCPNLRNLWETKVLGFAIGLAYVAKLTLLFLKNVVEIKDRLGDFPKR